MIIKLFTKLRILSLDGLCYTDKIVYANKCRKIELRNLKYCFSDFNCQKCSRKLKTPECNFCHRMVNYFQMFHMYVISLQSQTRAVQRQPLNNKKHGERSSKVVSPRPAPLRQRAVSQKQNGLIFLIRQLGKSNIAERPTKGYLFNGVERLRNLRYKQNRR